MIRTELVEQIVSYEPACYKVSEVLERIQSRGYKVLNVIEAKTNKMQGCNGQGFLIVYDTDSDTKDIS